MATERLRQKAAKSGIGERPRSDGRTAAIAVARRFCGAQIGGREVLDPVARCTKPLQTSATTKMTQLGRMTSTSGELAGTAGLPPMSPRS